MRLKHVALQVDNLEDAEGYYSAVFGMDAVTREAVDHRGAWRQVPHGADWEDIRRAGVDVRMAALRRDDFVIALFSGSSGGRPYLIGVVADPSQISETRSRLTREVVLEVDRPDALTFVDPFGVRWQLTGPQFLGAGDARGEWIDLQA